MRLNSLPFERQRQSTSGHRGGARQAISRCVYHLFCLFYLKLEDSCLCLVPTTSRHTDAILPPHADLSETEDLRPSPRCSWPLVVAQAQRSWEGPAAISGREHAASGRA